MLLSEEQTMIRDMARAFAEEQLAPHAADWDRDSTFPRAALAQMGELGLLGMLVPEAYDGAGVDHVAYEQLGAFCLTEPQAGSDAAALRCRAVRDGDHYVLDGTKQFITSGANAQLAIVFAVTDPDAGKRGITGFVVPTYTAMLRLLELLLPDTHRREAWT